jgi:hypothetical protein
MPDVPISMPTWKLPAGIGLLGPPPFNALSPPPHPVISVPIHTWLLVLRVNPTPENMLALIPLEPPLTVKKIPRRSPTVFSPSGVTVAVILRVFGLESSSTTTFTPIAEPVKALRSQITLAFELKARPRIATTAQTDDCLMVISTFS